MTRDENMPTVDLDWSFSFGGDPRFIGTEFYEPPTVYPFATAIELLQHLAGDDTHQSGFQNNIRERLKADPTATQWHKLRTKLGDTTHFQTYRRNPHYQHYHDAAAAVANRTATTPQQQMVQGLDAEIAASRVIVPAGQMLFHGRGDRDLDRSAPYPSFVSTSLDPTVCIYHAIKRKLEHGADARAVVYALTLEVPLPAIWGNGGSLDEWELLLQTKLTYATTQKHSQGRFDIIEASIRP